MQSLDSGYNSVANMSPETRDKLLYGTAIVGGAGLAIAAAPVALAAVGFTSGGIAAGSTAAWMMSLGGGATSAGGIVATCQSVGALGTVLGSVGATATAAGVGAGVGAGIAAAGSKFEQWITQYSTTDNKLIKETWEKFIRPNLIDIGVNTMLKLFKAHPHIQTMFPAFKNMSYDELKDNKKFHVHCQLIMNTIDSALNAFVIDDYELMECTLIMNGERHAQRGMINGELFEHVKEPLINSMKQQMKSQWTDELSKLWTDTVDMIFDIMIKAIINYNNNKSQ